MKTKTEWRDLILNNLITEEDIDEILKNQEYAATYRKWVSTKEGESTLITFAKYYDIIEQLKRLDLNMICDSVMDRGNLNACHIIRDIQKSLEKK